MADYITKIRTEDGDKQIDFNALANKPTAQSLGAAPATHTHTLASLGAMPATTTIPSKVSQLENDRGFKTTDNNTTYTLVKNGSTITLKGSDGSTTSVTDDNTTYALSSFGITASAADLNSVNGTVKDIQTQLTNKSNSNHKHGAADITSGVLSITRGGIGSSNGATGLKNLFAAGETILSSYQYGSGELPTPGKPGRIFFRKVSG